VKNIKFKTLDPFRKNKKEKMDKIKTTSIFANKKNVIFFIFIWKILKFWKKVTPRVIIKIIKTASKH